MYRETDNDDSNFTYNYIALAKQKITEDRRQWSNIFKVLKQKPKPKQNPTNKDFFTHRKYLSKFKAK